MRPPEKRTRVLGRLTAVLAFLLVFGQLANSTHLLLVRHTVCPFDGELVDAEPGSEPHYAAPGDAQAERLPIVTRQRGPEAHHGHEHCAFVWNRRNLAFACDRAFELLVPPRIAPVATLPDGASRSTGIALHRLAPKQSPPE